MKRAHPTPTPAASPMPRVLVVDGDAVAASALVEQVRAAGYEAEAAASHDAALVQLNRSRNHPFAALVLDANAPGGPLNDLLKRLRESHPHTPTLVVAAFGQLSAAVQAIRLGALNYLTRPLITDEFTAALQEAVQRHTLLTTPVLRDADDAAGYPLVGQHPAIAEARRTLQALASTRDPVLIVGESGVGKTHAARALHHADTLAFTWHTTRAGDASFQRFECPDDATLLIRDFQAATPDEQAALIQLIQHRDTLPQAGRVIAAATSTIDSLMDSKQLDASLLARLQLNTVRLPPLRERLEDLADLAAHALATRPPLTAKPYRLDPETLDHLRTRDWPGNVRAYFDAIEHAALRCPGVTIRPAHLPDTLRTDPPREANAAPASTDAWTPVPLHQAMQDPERRILLAALQTNGWNRQQTAKQLQIDRTTLYKKIKAHALDRPA